MLWSYNIDFCVLGIIDAIAASRLAHQMILSSVLSARIYNFVPENVQCHHLGPIVQDEVKIIDGNVCVGMRMYLQLPSYLEGDRIHPFRGIPCIAMLLM